MERHNLDIVILTETNGAICKSLPGRGKTFAITGKSGPASGVSCVYDPKRIFSESLRQTERIIELTLRSGVHVIGAYGFTEDASEFDKTRFWNSMMSTIRAAVKNHTAVVFIGDLNAGHEKQRGGRTQPGRTNFERLLDVVEKCGLKIAETGPTWKSARSMEATRTLDRCLTFSLGEHTTSATLDWELAVADHAVLVATIQFAEIDRNKGRVSKSPAVVTWLDVQWMSAKACLKLRRADECVSGNEISRFWMVRRKWKESQKEPLTIIGECGEALQPDAAVEQVAQFLRTLWGEGEEGELRYSGSREGSAPPNQAEVKRAIQKLKRDTAVGRDKIPTNAVLDDPNALKVYTDILRLVWISEEVPTVWRDMRVKPIPKKDACTTPAGTRPITCLSTSTKILNAVIAERGQVDYENALSPKQHAYRTGRSTTTALAAVIGAIQKRKKCVVAFLDMSKAFDKVTRCALGRALQRWNLPRTETELIISQYRSSHVYVELNGSIATPFLHRRGVRQGCTLSGMLFNLVGAEVHSKMELSLPGDAYDMFSYSDDYVIVANTEIEARVAERMLNSLLTDVGLSLNMGKREVMEFDVDSTDETSKEWLGVCLSKNLGWRHEVEARLSKAREAMSSLTTLCYKEQIKLDAKMMVNVIQSLVAVHLISGREIVKFTDEQTRTLLNELTRAILTHSQVVEETAMKIAESIWAGKDVTTDDFAVQTGGKKTKTVRKIPQSKSLTALPAVVYQNPDSADLQERRALVERLQEEETWCKLCKPPRQIKNHHARMKHRATIHKEGPTPPLVIHCGKCNRDVESKGYSRHLCVKDNAETNMVPCPWCSSNYSKFGIKNHMTACKKKAAPPQ